MNHLLMFDVVLKDQERLDALMLDDAEVGSTIQRLLGLSVAGIVLYGVVVAGAQIALAAAPMSHTMAIPASLTAAFVGALCVCLPSFYFYTQLAGIDASFPVIAAQALRVQATTTVFMLGALPLYAALAFASALGVQLFTPDLLLIEGLLLPFFLGLFGIHALYRAFTRIATMLPRTHLRRGRFLTRLVLCWGAVYSAVAPVALWRMLRFFEVM